jgi:hypothetical protein
MTTEGTDKMEAARSRAFGNYGDDGAQAVLFTGHSRRHSPAKDRILIVRRLHGRRSSGKLGF